MLSLSRTPKRQIKKYGKPPQINESPPNIANPSKKSRLILRAARLVLSRGFENFPEGSLIIFYFVRDSYSPNYIPTHASSPNKYTPEVRQLLLHPDASAVEPYRVLCAKCSEWVTMTTKYHLSTFRVHTTLICKNRNAKGTHGETTKR